MWWKMTLLVLALMLVCFVGGLYAGAAVFLKLTTGSTVGMAWDTLWEARHMALTDRRMLYLPWSWCVTAAITFFPVAITLLVFFFNLRPTTSLHGNARFANERELRVFEYKGEYQNTSK